jgi:hypothetical protein
MKACRFVCVVAPSTMSLDSSRPSPFQQTDLALVYSADLIYRLQIMDYESHFCLAKDVAPFSRIYFAVPSGNAA